MSESPASNYLRIFLVGLMVTLLGLTPYPRAATRYLLLANQSIARGNLLSASEDLASAGLYFPWRSDLNIQAGRLALEASDPKATILYFERPGTLSRLSYDDKVLLGDAYLQDGEAWMAEAIWKHLGESGGTSQVYERLANLYLQRRDYDAALVALQNLLALTPSDIPLYYQIGSLYAATHPIQALPFLIQAAQIDPVRATQARDLHDKIRTASLFDEPAYTFLIAGRQLANSGDWELARVAFLHAVDLRPDYADAWAFLGEARGQMSVQESGSVSISGFYELQHALQIDANSILANTFLGLYWERHEEYEQAADYLEHAVSLSPDDPFLYSELANILAKAGDLPAAQSVYEAAIRLNPREPLFYRLLAEFALEYQIQIRELALPAARQAIALDPDAASSLDVMAQVMLALLDYQSAERFSLHALLVDPTFSPAYLHLGTAYLYLGESEMAHQWLSLAQLIDPDSWIAAQAKRMLEYYYP
ncbi:MAG: hypothetical protein A2136_04605 [Chloroflexi bacterium RBG_16_54_11]|nr:MAG: hypothetical protein A2136_04605 [Chloroflexi bacterium RBG_16_54_11]